MDSSGYTPQEKMSVEEKGKEMGIEIESLEKFNDRLALATIKHGHDERFKVFPVREMMDVFPDILKTKINYNPEKDFARIKEQMKVLRQNEPRLRHCWQCTRAEEFGTAKLLKCGDCKKALYCSVECQIEHWYHHKIFCKKFVELKDEKKKIAIVSAKVSDFDLFFWDNKEDGKIKPIGIMNDLHDLPADIITDITNIGLEIAGLITSILNKETQIETAPKPEPKVTVIRVGKFRI